MFLHKVDADFMSEETKAERQQGIQHYVSTELTEGVLVSYYLTSIYDHSALEAFSKVVQKLVPELPTLNNLLDILIGITFTHTHFSLTHSLTHSFTHS